VVRDLRPDQGPSRLGRNWPSCRRYFASLLFCRPEAFRDSARELVKHNGEALESRVSEIGNLFSSLSIPKVFCWGTENLDGTSKQPPRLAASQQQAFAGASHWVMVDRAEEFYPFLREFCEKQAG
jgi:hypothetical protein